MSDTEGLSEPIPSPGAALPAGAVPQLEADSRDPGDLSDRVAVVSGGGWNIGRAVALALARNGARVVIASRNRDNLEATAAIAAEQDLRVRGIPADLTDPEQVRVLFDDVALNEGGAGILACLAGGYGCPVAVADSEPSEWLQVVLRNLYTTYLCCRAALPGMITRRRGDILTCAGGGAFFPMAGVHATAYASAKAAICRFTDQLYAEHMKVPGLRINCIEPGMTLSPPDLAKIEEQEARTGQVHPAREHNHPPEAGAELAMFVLSPAARGLNGRILSVDDDWWKDPDQVQQVIASDLYRLRRTYITES